MKPSVELSVVTSLYYSGPDVAEFHRRAGDTVQTLTSSYEIIFVNDGSPDDAFAQALALQKQDPHVVLVDLSRNFGHHSALMTGLAYARGKAVFIIDSDLEEDPEWLHLFHEVQQTKGSDVVYGVQDKRKGGVFERFTGWVFYKLLNPLHLSYPHSGLQIGHSVERMGRGSAFGSVLPVGFPDQIDVERVHDRLLIV